MPIEAEVDGVGILEFDDGTPDAVIQDVVNREVRKAGLRRESEAAGREIDTAERFIGAVDKVEPVLGRVSLGGLSRLSGAVAKDVLTSPVPVAFTGEATAAELAGQPTPTRIENRIGESTALQGLVGAAEIAPVAGAAALAAPISGLGGAAIGGAAALGASAFEASGGQPSEALKGAATGAAIPYLGLAGRVAGGAATGALVNRGATALANPVVQRAIEAGAGEVSIQALFAGELMASEEYKNASPEEQNRMMARQLISGVPFTVPTVAGAMRSGARPMASLFESPAVEAARALEAAPLQAQAQSRMDAIAPRPETTRQVPIQPSQVVVEMPGGLLPAQPLTQAALRDAQNLLVTPETGTAMRSLEARYGEGQPTASSFPEFQGSRINREREIAVADEWDQRAQKIKERAVRDLETLQAERAANEALQQEGQVLPLSSREAHQAMQGVSYRRPSPAPTEAEYQRRLARESVEEDLYTSQEQPEGGQRAIQEQGSNAEVLRNERPEVGLQEVAGGNARHEALAKAKAKPAQEGLAQQTEPISQRFSGAKPVWLDSLPQQVSPLSRGASSGLELVGQLWNEKTRGNPFATKLLGGEGRVILKTDEILSEVKDYPKDVQRAVDWAKSREEVITDEVQRQTQGQAPVTQQEYVLARDFGPHKKGQRIVKLGPQSEDPLDTNVDMTFDDGSTARLPAEWAVTGRKHKTLASLVKEFGKERVAQLAADRGLELSKEGDRLFEITRDGDRVPSPIRPFVEWATSADATREMSLLPGARQAAQAIGQAVGYARKKLQAGAQLPAQPAAQARPAVAPNPIPRRKRGPLAPAVPGAQLKTLDDAYKVFEPKPPPKPDKALPTRVAEGIRTGVASKYRPGGEFEEDILKAYGKPMPKLDLAAKFEQVAGAGGKAKLEVIEFTEAVEPLLKGIEQKDFNVFMLASRAKDRLTKDPARKKVDGWTIPDTDNVLTLLEQKLGPDRWQQIQQAGQVYQDHMDRALRLQVDSGRMSQETYQAIKDDTSFYAPFRVMKHALEQERPGGTGRSMDTMEQYAKKITGIEDPDFRLADMLAAGRQQIAISRMLAEKARPMQRVLELADIDINGIFARRLGPDEAPREGRGVVNVLENGKKVRVEVPENLENALKGPNETTNNFLKSLLQITGNTFRSGATLFHAAFQLTNLAAADQLRLAAMSRLGPRSPLDLYRYPMDFLHAAYASMAGNRIIPGKVPKLYRDFLRSGAAGANLQAFLSPKALQYEDPIKIAKQIGVAESLLTSPARFANAIEETTKVMGLKRAMRLSGAKSGKELSDRAADLVTEVRRYAGSPDFSRKGAWIEAAALNLIFMFLNARIQGTLADVGRLSGTSGIGTSATTLGKLMVGVGLPTALLHILNHLPENREDYELKSDVEKRNYWLIPKGFVGGGGPRYITNPQGERVRDYWRIPKRDIGQLFGNTIEAGMGFAEKNEPERYKKFAAELLENLAPVNIQGRTAEERLESVISSSNPLIKVPIEVGTGRLTFLHRDILPKEAMKESSPYLHEDKRTSDIAKWFTGLMPDWTPEIFRSPIKVDNLIQGLSASLITQFYETKGIKGRSGFEEWRLLRRFQTSGFVEDRAFVDRVRELRRQQADESLIRDKTSDAIIEANKGNPRAAIQAAIQTFRDDKAGVDRVAEKLMMEAANVTRQDKQLLALAPRQRAQMISEHIAQMDKTNSIKYLGELRKRRVLSDATIEELAKIRLLLKGLNAEQKPTPAP